MLETITDNNTTIALIIYSGYGEHGTHFPTPLDYGLQVGYISRNKDEIIKGHGHLPVSLQHNGPRQEFIYVRNGLVKVTFYNDDGIVIVEKKLKQGDTMLQVCGGHEFYFLEDTALIEVKQGPYQGQQIDKKYYE